MNTHQAWATPAVQVGGVPCVARHLLTIFACTGAPASAAGAMPLSSRRLCPGETGEWSSGREFASHTTPQSETKRPNTYPVTCRGGLDGELARWWLRWRVSKITGHAGGLSHVLVRR